MDHVTRMLRQNSMHNKSFETFSDASIGADALSSRRVDWMETGGVQVHKTHENVCPYTAPKHSNIGSPVPYYGAACAMNNGVTALSRPSTEPWPVTSDMLRFGEASTFLPQGILSSTSLSGVGLRRTVSAVVGYVSATNESDTPSAPSPPQANQLQRSSVTVYPYSIITAESPSTQATGCKQGIVAYSHVCPPPIRHTASCPIRASITIPGSGFTPSRLMHKSASAHLYVQAPQSPYGSSSTPSPGVDTVGQSFNCRPQPVDCLSGPPGPTGSRNGGGETERSANFNTTSGPGACSWEPMEAEPACSSASACSHHHHHHYQQQQQQQQHKNWSRQGQAQPPSISSLPPPPPRLHSITRARSPDFPGNTLGDAVSSPLKRVTLASEVQRAGSPAARGPIGVHRILNKHTAAAGVAALSSLRSPAATVTSCAFATGGNIAVSSPRVHSAAVAAAARQRARSGGGASTAPDGSVAAAGWPSLERHRLMLSSVSNLVQLRDTVAEDGNLAPRNKQALLMMIEDAMQEQQQQQQQQQQLQEQHKGIARCHSASMFRGPGASATEQQQPCPYSPHALQQQLMTQMQQQPLASQSSLQVSYRPLQQPSQHQTSTCSEMPCSNRSLIARTTTQGQANNTKTCGWSVAPSAAAPSAQVPHGSQKRHLQVFSDEGPQRHPSPMTVMGGMYGNATVAQEEVRAFQERSKSVNAIETEVSCHAHASSLMSSTGGGKYQPPSYQHSAAYNKFTAAIEDPMCSSISGGAAPAAAAAATAAAATIAAFPDAAGSMGSTAATANAGALATASDGSSKRCSSTGPWSVSTSGRSSIVTTHDHASGHQFRLGICMEAPGKTNPGARLAAVAAQSAAELAPRNPSQVLDGGAFVYDTPPEQVHGMPVAPYVVPQVNRGANMRFQCRGSSGGGAGAGPISAAAAATPVSTQQNGFEQTSIMSAPPKGSSVQQLQLLQPPSLPLQQLPPVSRTLSSASFPNHCSHWGPPSPSSSLSPNFPTPCTASTPSPSGPAPAPAPAPAQALAAQTAFPSATCQDSSRSVHQPSWYSPDITLLQPPDVSYNAPNPQQQQQEVSPYSQQTRSLPPLHQQDQPQQQFHSPPPPPPPSMQIPIPQHQQHQDQQVVPPCWLDATGFQSDPNSIACGGRGGDGGGVNVQDAAAALSSDLLDGTEEGDSLSEVLNSLLQGEDGLDTAVGTEFELGYMMGALF